MQMNGYRRQNKIVDLKRLWIKIIFLMKCNSLTFSFLLTWLYLEQTWNSPPQSKQVGRRWWDRTVPLSCLSPVDVFLACQTMHTERKINANNWELMNITRSATELLQGMSATETCCTQHCMQKIWTESWSTLATLHAENLNWTLVYACNIVCGKSELNLGLRLQHCMQKIWIEPWSTLAIFRNLFPSNKFAHKL